MKQRLIDGFLAAVALVSAATAVRGINLGVPVNDIWLFPTTVLLPGIIAIALVLSLRAEPATRLNVALLTLSIIASLYAVESALQLLLPAHPPARDQVAIADGRTWDRRPRAQVALDLRASGTHAMIILPARTLRQSTARGGAGVEVAGRSIVPLANVADRPVVNCNESGTMTWFRTDEYGYNNPGGTWQQPIDVALIGDSFVVGSCVAAEDNAVAKVRERGIRVAGAGVIDFGPLSELGVLKEYIAPIRPADVFWFYYEWNDLHDLRGELQVPELVDYLRPDYTQHLLEIQPSVDARLAEFTEALLDEHGSETTEPVQAAGDGRRALRAVLDEWVKLYRLRHSVGLAGVRERINDCCDLDAYRDAVLEAKRTVDTWGGRLHLVYLPAAVRYYGPASAITNDAMRQRRRVLKIASEAGLSIVDLHRFFLENGGGKAMFFDFRSHFNELGYQTTADAIVRHLERLGAAAN